MSISVPRNERGVVRLFALSMTDDQAKRLRDGPPSDPGDIIGDAGPEPGTLSQQRKLLGATFLDEKFTEVFRVSDLDDLGLTGYMIDGNGVDPNQVLEDSIKLAMLDGWVMVVYSAAFVGQAMTLKPARELTLIGTYNELGTDWSSDIPLTSKAATEPAKQPTKPSDAAILGRVASIALLLMFALTGFIIWMAG